MFKNINEVEKKKSLALADMQGANTHGSEGNGEAVDPESTTEGWADDERSEQPMQTEQAICAARDEFFEKVWYVRHERLQRRREACDPEIRKIARATARRIRAKYGEENLSFDAFEWGMVNGKLSALRWVLGYEWDMLDT